MKVGLVFDLDDTLYPERSYNFSGFDAVGEHVRLRCGVDGFSQTCKRLYLANVRGDIFDQAVKYHNITLPVSDLVTTYREHIPRIELFDDAKWLLNRIVGQFPLGLITDGYAQVQRNKISALGISPLFDSLIYTDDFGRKSWKPSDVPYRETMLRMATMADRFIYIGDNPTKDFVTANLLGWLTVMVHRPTNLYNLRDMPNENLAHCSITSLREFPLEKFREKL